MKNKIPWKVAILRNPSYAESSKHQNHSKSLSCEVPQLKHLGQFR